MAGKCPSLFASLFLALGILVAFTACSVPVSITVDTPATPAYECGTQTTALVTRVIDGDTLAVTTRTGRNETVRVLGIDTPETEDHGNWGNEFAGISDPSYLTSWGRKASGYTESLVKDKSVTLSTDCQAGGHDRYGRLLAYVGYGGSDLGATLLREGYARVYTEESFGRKTDYLSLQAEAQAAGAGLWSAAQSPAVPRNGPVSIVSVQYDAPGDDRENLNGEYIVLASRETINLKGWTVADNSGTVYTFSDVILHPGNTLTLHVGYGVPSETHLYWNLTAPLLGNDADAVTVRDPAGKAIATFRWGS